MSNAQRLARHTRIGALALALSAGCTTWRPHGDLARAVAVQPGRPVRVVVQPSHDTTGARPAPPDTLTFRRASVVGDSLVGETDATWTQAARRRAVALADVRDVATREVALGRTLGAVVGGSAVTLALLAGAAYVFLIERIGP